MTPRAANAGVVAREEMSPMRTADYLAGVAERFWPKVDKAGECWLWTASTTGSGYGQIRVKAAGRAIQAHRVAYELVIGPIPPGKELDHLCRNRLCVNPSHLEPVTGRENLRRGDGFAGLNARKTQCVHGHPLEGENLYVDPKGRRQCRTCRRQSGEEFAARNPTYKAEYWQQWKANRRTSDAVETGEDGISERAA